MAIYVTLVCDRCKSEQLVDVKKIKDFRFKSDFRWPIRWKHLCDGCFAKLHDIQNKAYEAESLELTNFYKQVDKRENAR